MQFSFILEVFCYFQLMGRPGYHAQTFGTEQTRMGVSNGTDKSNGIDIIVTMIVTNLIWDLVQDVLVGFKFNGTKPLNLGV